VLMFQKTPESPAAEGHWIPISGDEQIVVSSPAPLANGQSVRAIQADK